MNKIVRAFAALSLVLAACNASGIGSASDAVVLDVRCADDSGCPSGFECESEVEHGVDVSYCVSHDEDAAQNGECPAGYELETEHEGTFCKPHGGADDGGAGGDDSGAGGDDTGAGGDDSGVGGAGGADDNGAGAGGADDHGGA